MIIRKPKIVAPDLEQTQALVWHSLQCEVVTPMYGGGVEAATVDMKLPIRASAIRGQLRFWWRLLAKNKWKLGNTKAIRDAEFALWGGMGDDSGGRASQVLLKVQQQPKISEHDLSSYVEYSETKNEKKLSYVLFPAANAKDKEVNPHQLLKIDRLHFQLDIAFSATLQHEQKLIDQVVETLQWWANFGGLGARTRRGLGAVHVAQCDDYPEICQILSDNDVSKAGCHLKIRTAKSADSLQQLQNGIAKLSEFRQKAELGRNKGTAPKPAGRSRWPEPDALRRIHRTHHVNHAPEHAAGNIFPRAMFGLPIIFHFVGAGEPRDSQLTPVNGDRLASPVIIRPYHNGTVNKDGKKEWSAAALVLPHEHIKYMQVSIGGRETYPIWNTESAAKIRPIHDNQGIDPLAAFLHYFAN